jgi:hypothetical protein
MWRRAGPYMGSIGANRTYRTYETYMTHWPYRDSPLVTLRSWHRLRYAKGVLGLSPGWRIGGTLGFNVNPWMALKECKIEFGGDFHRKPNMSQGNRRLFYRSFRAARFSYCIPRVPPSLHPGLSPFTPLAYMCPPVSSDRPLCLCERFDPLI